MPAPEPELRSGLDAEEVLRRAVIAEIHTMLTQAHIRYILLESFGLDVAVFAQCDDNSYARFIEVKAFIGGRPGGLRAGSHRDASSQVNRLLRDPVNLPIIDSFVRWILGVGTEPIGAPRYAFFTSVQARGAVIVSMERDNEDNLRVSTFQNNLVTWEELLAQLKEFLLPPTP